MAEVVQLEVWIPAKTGQNTQYWTDFFESSCWFIPSNHMCLCVSTDHLKLGWLTVNNKIRSAANCKCNRNMNHQGGWPWISRHRRVPHAPLTAKQGVPSRGSAVDGCALSPPAPAFWFPSVQSLETQRCDGHLAGRDLKGCNGGWICWVLPLFGMM